MTSARWLERQLSRLGTRGRKGASVLRSILDEGDEEKWPSWLERRFIRLLHGAHMSEYEREHRACGGKYRLDFAWPGALLGIEVHGGKWHRRRLRWDEDLARHNELTAAGWTILHFTFKQLRDDPARVIAEIRATYDRLWGGRLDVFSR